MKATKYIFSTVLALFLLFACSEEFLDIKPPNNLSEADYYKTEQQAIETVTSCYDPLKHPGGININFFFFFEAFSDRGMHEQAVINNFAFDSRYSMVLNIYTYMFKGVYRCNVALQKIPPIVMNEDLKARLLGEVKFLRAQYYFYLTIIYNKPPLITVPLTDLSVKLTNATREELYAQIVSDLTDAVAILPYSYPPDQVGRATKGAALGLLGKTYLYFQDFEKAKQCFLEIRESGVYSLMTPQGIDSLDYCYAYQCNFAAVDLKSRNATYDSENNHESVFEIQFNYGGWTEWQGGYEADGRLTDLYFGPDGYRNLAPTHQYAEQFELAPASHPAGLKYDPRRYVTLFEKGDTITYLDGSPPVAWDYTKHTNVSIYDGYGWEKYFAPAHKSNNGPDNIRLMRYSDVLLMLAEADFQVNNGVSPQLALDCINEVRERVGLDPITVVTAQAIIHERDVEFGFECLRFHDLVRWSLLPEDNPLWVDIESIITKYKKGKNEYLPIPMYEINLAGGNLKQNPGW
jgi:hypothetical protein